MNTIDLKSDFIDNEPIMDSIYGVIKISPFEKRIISTKEMQRLRGIKQLGFVNLVYPDAEHSRFAHSIGVCHQAKMMIHHIETNLKYNDRYKKWRIKFKNNIDENIDISLVERIIISVSALLHDLPHSPFSHEIETPNINDNGLPIHDDFEKNHVFFNYLFNINLSELAEIINIYNNPFVELLKDDDQWKKVLKNDSIEDGYVIIQKDGNILDGDIQLYQKLPLLGVMIFELLLFDKVNTWLDIQDNGTVKPNRKGILIKINEEGNTIKWKYIEEWFRPYRKDIVANTICADLLDYLIRDGKNTGILPSIDLKFFDRMTIAKAIPDQTNTLIPLDRIPDFCEHVVFDIFDHKRGVIRQSVITEIISFLQQRYLLAERVYNHRVVEGARSMLQEASYLLVENNVININELHDTNNIGGPITDDSFFSWVLKLNSNGKKDIVKAQKLVSMIKNRRIYRELVIIDGILGLHKGSFRGSDVNCKTLADVLLDYKTRKTIIEKLEEKVSQYCEKNNINCHIDDKEKIFTIGVRKYGKRYKVPKVLVAKPITNLQEDDIETFPLFEGKKLPSINDRLESMQLAYNSLWKVYLFIHPFFHQQSFKDLHDELSEIFLTELYDKTNIKWENSIDKYSELLPNEPIDIPTFIMSFADEKNKFNNKYLIKSIIDIINNKIPAESENFKLNKKNDVKTILTVINKNKNLVNKLLCLKDNDKKRLIDSFEKKFKPKFNVAARDEDEIIKQVIDFIEKYLPDEQSNLF